MLALHNNTHTKQMDTIAASKHLIELIHADDTAEALAIIAEGKYNFNCVDDFGKTPLIYALIEGGSTDEIILALIATGNFNTNIETEEGFCTFINAFLCYEYKVTYVLLTNGTNAADFDKFENRRTFYDKIENTHMKYKSRWCKNAGYAGYKISSIQDTYKIYTSNMEEIDEFVRKLRNIIAMG